MCDLPMEHPSVSRYHAILQFREDGALFLYDLGSGHGTRVNKKTIAPREFHRLYDGIALHFMVEHSSHRSRRRV